ncbi:MAG: hypothetical protein P9L99_04355 [Candidatus Lernaella stagnicola]|nr:hypothetical protein [Candidatus Lernaella stagnicola]
MAVFRGMFGFCLAVLLVSFGVFGCAEDQEQDNAEIEDADDESGDILPADVSLLIAGDGGVLFAEAGERRWATTPETVFHDVAITSTPDEFLTVGFDEQRNRGVVFRVDVADGVAEPVDLSVDCEGITFLDAVSSGEETWIVGADHQNGCGVVLFSDGESWARVDIEPPAASESWWLTAVSFFGPDMFVAGFDETNWRDVYYIRPAGGTLERLDIVGSPERTVYPRRFFPIENQDAFWLVGSYLDMPFDPMMYWAEKTQDWHLASSCIIPSHRVFWGGEVDGKIVFVGSRGIGDKKRTFAFSDRSLPFGEQPMIIEWDPTRVRTDGLGEEYHWFDLDVPLPDGRIVLRVYETAEATYYLYWDNQGWLKLYCEQTKAVYRLTDAFCEVVRVKFL